MCLDNLIYDKIFQVINYALTSQKEKEDKEPFHVFLPCIDTVKADLLFEYDIN